MCERNIKNILPKKKHRFFALTFFFFVEALGNHALFRAFTSGSKLKQLAVNYVFSWTCDMGVVQVKWYLLM